MPLNKQALNIQLMFVSINKMICFSQKESIMTPPHPPFSRSVAVTEMMEASARVPMDQWSPHQSLQSASIVPVGGQLSVGGEGGTLTGMWIAVNQRTIEGNKETRKKWLDWEKKKLHSVLSVLVCVFIYIFFLFEHFFNTRIRKSTRQ